MEDHREDPSTNLRSEIGKKLSHWILVTIDPLLLIVHLTLVYVIFLKADDFLLKQISHSFEDIISASMFAQNLLLGVRMLSALGVAIGYGLHTIYQLYLEGRHVAKVLRRGISRSETEI